MDENDALKAYNNIYLEIIMRYKEQIEEKEGLYLADLPKLVTPNDDNVMLLAKDIQANFPVFNYDENFPEAARLGYEYVKNKITPISLPIQFWLRPAQTLNDISIHLIVELVGSGVIITVYIQFFKQVVKACKILYSFFKIYGYELILEFSINYERPVSVLCNDYYP